MDGGHRTLETVNSYADLCYSVSDIFDWDRRLEMPQGVPDGSTRCVAPVAV